MNEPKYQYYTTNTSVHYNTRGIKGSLEFGVGGPIAAATVGKLFEEVNELEEQIAALRTALETATREKINKFYDGVLEGVFMYAWWADGGLQVGTSGRTFTEAQIEIEKDRAAALNGRKGNGTK